MKKAANAEPVSAAGLIKVKKKELALAKKEVFSAQQAQRDAGYALSKSIKREDVLSCLHKGVITREKADELIDSIAALEAAASSSSVLQAKRNAVRIGAELEELRRGRKAGGHGAGRETMIKKSTVIWLMAIVLAFVVLTTFFVIPEVRETAYNGGYRTGYDEAEAEQSKVINYKTRLIEDFMDEKRKREEILGFYEQNAVICTTEGYRYHRYGCGHLQGHNYYIFNTEYAKSMGYTPCLDCFN